MANDATLRFSPDQHGGAAELVYRCGFLYTAPIICTDYFIQGRDAVAIHRGCGYVVGKLFRFLPMNG